MGNGLVTHAATLAERAGVNRVTAWRWLTGRTIPSRLALARLVALGIALPTSARGKKKRR